MAIVRIEDLSFAYPGASRNALDAVSLELEAGTYACICGPSGSGKTTLLRQLKTPLAPHGHASGHVLFDGVPMNDVPAREQAARIGFVMQNPDAQIVMDRVWHELAFGLENLGCDPAVMRMRVAEMASYFGIQDWFHADVSTLSGGQRQLLNLASVMAMHPDVLVLDEPTSQLDPVAAAGFLQTVRKLNLDLGTTIIISEHRLEDVFPVADEVIVMDAGRIVTRGTPRDVCRELHAMGGGLALGLPTPARIFHGVSATSAIARDTEECPLTVREGRAWLASCVDERPPSRRALDAPAHTVLPADRALSIKDLWVRYDKDGPDILRGVDLELGHGGVFAIVGGNGAGKSTLLKAICGAVRAYRGTMRVLGTKITRRNAHELAGRGVIMIGQDPLELFAKATVHAELAEMLDDAQLDADSRRRAIDEVLRSCELVGLEDAHPLDLSGGEQQRVALAKALLSHPRILLLDEPTKGMDAAFKLRFGQMLRTLVDEGVTVVIVSHDVEFCARNANAVAMLFDGQVVSIDTPRRLFGASDFYTTAASRMSRGIFANAIVDEDVIELCQS